MAKKERPSKRYGAPEAPKKEKIDAELEELSAHAQQIEKQIITLNSEKLEEFSSWICERLNTAKKSKMWIDTKDRIKRMREYYESGVPRTYREMKGAHDYRTMHSASLADGMKARIVGIFTQDPIARIEGRNEQGRLNQINTERLIDYHHDVNVHLPMKGDTICSYDVVEGHAVIYAPWRLEIDEEYCDFIEKQVYWDGKGKTRLVNIYDPKEVAEVTAAGMKPKEPPEFEVVESIHPEIIKNYPDPEIRSLLDYLCPADSKPTTPPEWEAVLEWYSMDRIMELESQGKFYKGTAKKIAAHLKKNRKSDDDEPTSKTAKDVDTGPSEKDALDAVVPMWSLWGKAKVPGQKSLKKIQCIVHLDSETTAHLRYNPYIGKPSPFFHIRLFMAPWRFAGIGVVEISCEGERAMNDISNYVLDDGFIKACLKYKYKKGRFPGGMPPFELWKGIGVKADGDWNPINLPDSRPMDLNVANFIRANTERHVGVGDLQLGRESDVTGKQPPTARGVMSVIREGQVKFNLLNFSMVGELMRFVEYELTLFQQLLGQKTAVEILGEDGKNLFPNGLTKRQILGSFRFIPNSSAQTLIRELEAEINLNLYEMFKDNKLIAGSIDAYYDMTKDLLLSFGKKKLWLRPLSEYKKVAGREQPVPSANLTPEEQQYVQSLMDSGMSLEQAKMMLESARTGTPLPTAEGGEGDMQATQELLMGGAPQV